jgi:2Fe-2S ferredoxin
MNTTTINFIHFDGRRQSVDATGGGSVMQLAVGQGIDAIVAECGGNAMCATCHVYVDDQWIDRLAAMNDEEDALLDGVATDRRPTSRLSCQIKIEPELDGLLLRLPERQV